MRQSPPEDEKETVLGILSVALGVGITRVVIGGALGFLFGFLGGVFAGTGLVVILRGER